MKKKLLIAVLIIGLLIPACFAVAELMNITTAGVDGNWVIYDKSKSIIATFDADNRKITIPSGSNITVSSGGTFTGTGTVTLTSPTLTSPTLSGPLFTISATHVFTTLADWVLSASEMLKTLLVADSGSGGANIVVNGGTAGDLKIVNNIGDGTFTIKESGQTGVAIASGKTAIVMHNGTDYIRITADATNEP